MHKINIGDLVEICSPYDASNQRWVAGEGLVTGIVVGFNKKGEGGKNCIHVLCGDIIQILNHWDVRVVRRKNEKG